MTEEEVAAVTVTPTLWYRIECGETCDRPETHLIANVETESIAEQIADVRRRQHGTEKVVTFDMDGDGES